jgi:hypothetical protein
MNFYNKNKTLVIVSGSLLGIGILLYFLKKISKSSNSSKPSKSIVIGDSQSINISKNNNVAKIISEEQSEKSLWKSGQNLNWLKNAVSKYPKSSDIGNVVISIGTNGGYNKNEDISGLFSALKTTFPKADFYAVKGSWGWGNIKNVTEDRVNDYYAKFKSEGAQIIKTPIGKTDNPHTNLPIYKIIGKEIEQALK